MRQARFDVLVAIACALAISSACGGAVTPTSPTPPSSAPTDTLPSPSPTIVFVYEEGVAQDVHPVVEEGIAIGQEFLEEHYGWKIGRQVTVRVTTNAEYPSAYATAQEIVVHTQALNWTQSPDAYRRKTMVHEMFHVFQNQNGWGNQTRWLREGSAEYVASKAALVDKGVVSATQEHGCRVWGVAFSPPLGPLANYENTIEGPDGGAPINLFYLAVEHLVDERGLGVLKRVSDFQNAFGVSQSEFYTDFEEYRKTWQRPARYECPSFR